MTSQTPTLEQLREAWDAAHRAALDAVAATERALSAGADSKTIRAALRRERAARKVEKEARVAYLDAYAAAEASIDARAAALAAEEGDA